MDAYTCNSRILISQDHRNAACSIKPEHIKSVWTLSQNFINFKVHGKVIGKGRPHFVKKTGAAITPGSTKSYESIIRDTAYREMSGIDPWTFPVIAIIVASYSIPKSWSRTKREQAERQLIAPAKPDADNVVKIVLDACNRTVYVDDTQVVQCLVVKKFADSSSLEVMFAEALDTGCLFLQR